MRQFISEMFSITYDVHYSIQADDFTSLKSSNQAPLSAQSHFLLTTGETVINK